jgi:hypothetical protein
MSKPMIRIHDISTNEIIDREMTDAEFAVYETEQQNKTLEQNKLEAKAASRQAILNRLGLTAEEAQLLLGGN